MLRATFHCTIVWHASCLFAAHAFVHALRATQTTMHFMVTIFHHHLMTAIVHTITPVMCNPANATADKANEKDETDYDKEPGDKQKEFAGHFLSEFCKQQGACKNSEQRNW